jgi:hypothetical protein
LINGSKESCISPYLVKKGHGKSPNIDLRKADCPAYGKKCAKCQQKGHWSEGEFDAKAMVKRSRDYFTNFNILEEIATDGGPQILSDIFQKSLKAWEIRHRLSSAFNPHSNCRAELAMKVGKKL